VDVARALIERDIRGPEFHLLESLPADPRILGVLYRSRSLIERSPSDLSVIELRSLIDVVGRASPPNSDVVLKRNITASLTAKLVTAEPQEVLALANLSIPQGWPGAESIDGAVRNWTKARFFALDGARAGQLLGRINDRRYQGWWPEAVRSGIRDAFERGTLEAIARSLWRWTNERPTSFVDLDEVRNFTSSEDEPLAELAPRTISGDAAGELLRVAQRRSLPHLHSIAVTVLFEPGEALRQQQAFANGNEGLRTLLKRLTGKQLVELATGGISEALPRAAEALQQQPSLLDGFDVHNAHWRALLSRAGVNGWQPWKAFAAPKAVVDEVVAYLGGTERIDHGFVDVIAPDFPSLLGSNGRSRLWSRLRAPAAQTMMRSTAVEVLELIMRGETVTIEPELQSVVADLVVEELNAKHLTDESVATLLTELPAAVGQIVDGWMRTRPTYRALPTATAVRIGRAIHSAGAAEVARRLFEHFSRGGHWQLRPVLVECRELFPLSERWKVPTRHNMTWNEKHELFTELREIGCALYPEGPTVDLWEDAGGDASGLPKSPTGAECWQIAIHSVEHGHRRAPNARRLVSRMLRDFSGGPQGEKLELMLKLLEGG
jgi:hypothetical protein